MHLLHRNTADCCKSDTYHSLAWQFSTTLAPKGPSDLKHGMGCEHDHDLSMMSKINPLEASEGNSKQLRNKVTITSSATQNSPGYRRGGWFRTAAQGAARQVLCTSKYADT